MIRNFNIFFIRRQNSRVFIPNLTSVINRFSVFMNIFIQLIIDLTTIMMYPDEFKSMTVTSIS